MFVVRASRAVLGHGGVRSERALSAKSAHRASQELNSGQPPILLNSGQPPIFVVAALGDVAWRAGDHDERNR